MYTAVAEDGEARAVRKPVKGGHDMIMRGHTARFAKFAARLHTHHMDVVDGRELRVGVLVCQVCEPLAVGRPPRRRGVPVTLGYRRGRAAFYGDYEEVGSAHQQSLALAPRVDAG